MKIIIVFITVSLMSFGALEITASDARWSAMRKSPTDLHLGSLGLERFEIVTNREMTTPECNHGRLGHDVVDPSRDSSFIVLDGCHMAIRNYFEPIHLIQLRPSDGFLSPEKSADVFIHGASYHFDETSQVIIDQEKILNQYSAQCIPEVRESRFFLFFRINRVRLTCTLMDFLGHKIGNLSLTEI